MQTNILERNRDADLRVYVVWLDPYGTPSRSSWDPALVDDPRVVEFWDPTRVVGNWFGSSENPRFAYAGPVAWDAWFLFGSDSRWTQEPSHLVGSGWTVIDTAPDLKRQVEQLT